MVKFEVMVETDDGGFSLSINRKSDALSASIGRYDQTNELTGFSMT